MNRSTALAVALAALALASCTALRDEPVGERRVLADRPEHVAIPAEIAAHRAAIAKLSAAVPQDGKVLWDLPLSETTPIVAIVDDIQTKRFNPFFAGWMRESSNETYFVYVEWDGPYAHPSNPRLRMVIASTNAPGVEPIEFRAGNRTYPKDVRIVRNHGSGIGDLLQIDFVIWRAGSTVLRYFYALIPHPDFKQARLLVLVRLEDEKGSMVRLYYGDTYPSYHADASGPNYDSRPSSLMDMMRLGTTAERLSALVYLTGERNYDKDDFQSGREYFDRTRDSVVSASWFKQLEGSADPWISEYARLLRQIAEESGGKPEIGN